MAATKRSKKVETAPSQVDTPVGVIILSAISGFMSLFLCVAGIDRIQDGLDAAFDTPVHPLLILGAGLFGTVAALRFLLLRRDGWVLILITALLLNPAFLLPNGSASGLTGISLALLVYLFTPAVKRLYRIESGPTL